MGTSTSYRAPAQPRWNAFVAALASGESVARVRSELFNAGNEWESALATPAVSAYADSLAKLFEGLPARLADAPDSGAAVAAMVVEAKRSSLAEGFSPALALAERAFLRVVIQTSGGLSAADDADGPLADRWRDRRGDSPEALVSQFTGELLGQYARHVIDREAGRLATGKSGPGEPAALSGEVAREAADLGRDIASRGFTAGESVVEAWPRVLRDTFRAGRQLPTVDEA